MNKETPRETILQHGQKVYWPGVINLMNNSEKPIRAIRVGNEYKFLGE